MRETRYIYPRSRQFELLASLFSLGMGLVIWIGLVSKLSVPMQWSTMPVEQKEVVAWLLVGSGLVHAIGVRINGAWRWSPFLRLAGMAMNASVMTWLCLSGPGPVVSYVFCWITLLMVAGVLNAGRDARRAAQNRRPLWTN
jgi:hypothetical protein